MGWLVITVGSVGIGSAPTCAQPDNCNISVQCPGPDCCQNTALPCWDPSLWYEPSADPASPWNDFNYFYGEKDVAWALQHIAHDAADANTLHVDPSRIVVAGTSGGSVYAAFVAFAEPAWDPATFAPLELSEQVQTPVAPAAAVLFDPITWNEGAPPQGALNGLSGGHWPQAALPRERTPWIQQVTPLEVLRSQSTSRWIREATRQVPVFVANGDADPTRSGFGRDGSTAAVFPHVGPADYARASGPLPSDQEPLFTSPDIGVGEPPPLIHDTWHALILPQDLRIADEAFHAEHSQTWLRSFTSNWSFFPNVEPFMPAGSAPLADWPAVPDVSQLLLVDGLFGADVGGDFVRDDPTAIVCGPNNLEVARPIFEWLDDQLAVGVEHRNGGSNPDVYRATTPREGDAMELVVDLNGVHPDYEHAEILAWLASEPFSLTLGGGQVLLVTPGPAEEAVLAQGLTPEDASGMVRFDVPIPRAPSFLGLSIQSQACLYDLVPEGVKMGFLLSNAQDLRIQGGFLPDFPFVNEIHYDDAGVDQDEYVEIAAPASTLLAAYDLHVYDQNGMHLYAVQNIGQLTEDAAGNQKGLVSEQHEQFGTLRIDMTPHGGLPDEGGGIVLVDPLGNVVTDSRGVPGPPVTFEGSFIGWEGVVTTMDGPDPALVGLTSFDIGVAEDEVPEGESLQRTGGPGVAGPQFGAWLPPQPNTFGNVNPGQSFVPE